MHHFNFVSCLATVFWEKSESGFKVNNRVLSTKVTVNLNTDFYHGNLTRNSCLHCLIFCGKFKTKMAEVAGSISTFFEKLLYDNYIKQALLSTVVRVFVIASVASMKTRQCRGKSCPLARSKIQR